MHHGYYEPLSVYDDRGYAFDSLNVSIDLSRSTDTMTDH